MPATAGRAAAGGAEKTGVPAWRSSTREPSWPTRRNLRHANAAGNTARHNTAVLRSSSPSTATAATTTTTTRSSTAAAAVRSAASRPSTSRTFLPSRWCIRSVWAGPWTRKSASFPSTSWTEGLTGRRRSRRADPKLQIPSPVTTAIVTWTWRTSRTAVHCWDATMMMMMMIKNHRLSCMDQSERLKQRRLALSQRERTKLLQL